MKLKAVVALNEEEYKRYLTIWNDLKEKTGGKIYKPMHRDECFCNYARVSGYAKMEHTGMVTQYLIDKLGRQPTELEISMICDGGFSHYGGACFYNTATREFNCTIYID